MQSARQRAGSKKLPQSQHPSCTQTPLKLFVLLADDGDRDDHGGVGDHDGDDGAVDYGDNDEVFYYDVNVDDNDQEEEDCFFFLYLLPPLRGKQEYNWRRLISIKSGTEYID